MKMRTTLRKIPWGATSSVRWWVAERSKELVAFAEKRRTTRQSQDASLSGSPVPLAFVRTRRRDPQITITRSHHLRLSTILQLHPSGMPLPTMIYTRRLLLTCPKVAKEAVTENDTCSNSPGTSYGLTS